MVRVCVTGCLHGELDRVYVDIARHEAQNGFKTDLVICTGDFQAVRNAADLDSMSIPVKYYAMGDFWRYYAEEKRAPILTIFIGGNHESSWYLQELPYGGWVAPNIWYMGYCGVVQFRGLRIAGLSGIYKQHDYTMHHYEHPPYSEASKRSAYHVRNLDVFRLGQLRRRRLDAVVSHDWPRGVYRYGDVDRLLRVKRHFVAEVEDDALGSPSGEQLLCRLRPRFWFAGHMHVKFAAVVQHCTLTSDPSISSKTPADQPVSTKFLALDKCLNRRPYLQFVDMDPPAVPPDESDLVVSLAAGADPDALFLDPEWLAVLQSTNRLASVHQVPCILPGPRSTGRFDFSPTRDELAEIFRTFDNQFSIPLNFERTAPVYKADQHQRLQQQSVSEAARQPIYSNPQTELLCAMLDLVNPNALYLGKASYSFANLCSNLVAKQNEENDDHDDDIPEDDDEEAFGNMPSPKTTEYVPTSKSFNPDEIDLDNDSGSSDADGADASQSSTACPDNHQYIPTLNSGCAKSPKTEIDSSELAANTGSESEYVPTIPLSPTAASSSSPSVAECAVDTDPVDPPEYDPSASGVTADSDALLSSQVAYDPEKPEPLVTENPEEINLGSTDDEDESTNGAEPCKTVTDA